MAESLLILAILVFGVRGLFLGFVGVISRVAGIILGYIITYSQQEAVSQYVLVNTQWDVSPLVVQIASGICLFFGTVLVTGLLVSLVVRVLAKIIPSLKILLDNESIGGRCLGAVTNGAIGAAIVLAGIWAYNIVAQKPPVDSQLHAVANSFGNSVFTMIGGDQAVPAAPSGVKNQDQSPGGAQQPNRNSGSAVIISEENPNKKFSIEATGESRASDFHSSPENTEESALLPRDNIQASDSIQKLLSNPKLQEIVTEQIEKNPEKIQGILNNPLVKKLLGNSSEKE